MQVKLSEQISSADAEIILMHLPDWIQEALIAPATEIDYPIEAIIEMAIASFLDTEALIYSSLLPLLERSLNCFVSKYSSPNHSNSTLIFRHHNLR